MTLENLNPSNLPQPTAGVTQLEIDQRVYDLYDEYCHGRDRKSVV